MHFYIWNKCIYLPLIHTLFKGDSKLNFGEQGKIFFCYHQFLQMSIAQNSQSAGGVMIPIHPLIPTVH